MPDGSIGELKGLIEDGNRAFEAFKAAHDQQIEDLKKGKADVLLDEKVDRVNADLGETLAKLESWQERLTEVENAGARPGGLGGDGTDEKTQKRARAFKAMCSGLPADQVEPDLEGYEAYQKGFWAYLRRGGEPTDIRNAISVGSDPGGGYWVLPEVSERVVTRLFETSPMRSVAGQETIGSDALEMPIDPNDATTGGWVSEKEARGETGTPEVGEQRIPVHEQYANPRITQKALDDAQRDLEAWLSNKIADKFARVENAAFVNGDGTGKPRGFLDYGAGAAATEDASRAWGVLQFVASGANGAFAASDPGDKLIDLVHSINPNYRQNARFAMNRATLAEVRKLKDGQGNYLWSSNFQAGQPTMLLQYPTVEMEDMPDIAADSLSIAFGDFQEGYLILDRAGFRTLRDPFTAKPYVQFYTTKRVGGDVVNFDALKLFKFAA